MLARVHGVIRQLLDRVRPDRITPASPPLSFTDSSEREIHVRPYRPDDFEGLVSMYDDFDPAQRAQGTPPIRTEDIRDWLTGVLEGVNVVALYDDRPVGHISFVPDGTDRHELAIFVHQEFQRAGIGTNLMAAGLGHAREQGVGYVWLSVEVWKRDIQRFYSRAGFSVVNPMGAAHRMSRTL
jgi:ribosomal protein S18 acetylase RimI-like enzyme